MEFMESITSKIANEIDTLSESLKAMQQVLDEDENASEDEIDFFSFTQENGYDPLSIKGSEHGQSTQTSSSDTVFPETPESPVVTTPPVTANTSQSFLPKGFRTPTFDVFNKSPTSVVGKRKSQQSQQQQQSQQSQQYSIDSPNKLGHRTVISEPNEDSPKRFKSSNSTPINTNIYQTPKRFPIQQQQQLQVSHTPSPPRQSFFQSIQQDQQQQNQQYSSNNNYPIYNNNNNYSSSVSSVSSNNSITSNSNHSVNSHGHSYNSEQQQQLQYQQQQLQVQQQQQQQQQQHNDEEMYYEHQEFPQPQKQVPQQQNQDQFAVPQYPSMPEINKTLKLGKKEYMICSRIGSGGSSQVYSAYSIKDQKSYALKYIEIKRKEDRNNVVSEISLLKSMGSIDRVAALRYYYSIPKSIYLVIELGEIDLASLIKSQAEKGWDFTFICYYWEQMTRAVDAIHSKNIVHCDLKPANFVLIRGILKLIDFGISKALQDDTTNIQKESQVGTFNYMSPESFEDLNGPAAQNVLVKQGRASDIWALGCILYLMVYGRTPFSHIAMPQKIYCIMDPKHQIAFDKEILTSKGDFVTAVPPKVIRTLKSCLERDKMLRPRINELLTYKLYDV